jgi:hypothetical protein
MVDLTGLSSIQINEYFNQHNLMATRYKTTENYIKKLLEIDLITTPLREDIYKIIRNKKTIWEVIDKNSGIIIKEFTDKCLANMDESHKIFEEFCENDTSYFIKLMPTYLKLFNKPDDRALGPIREFFKSPIAYNVIKDNILIFVNDVFPVLIRLGWMEKFNEIGLNFHYMTFDSEIQRFFVDQISIQINNSKEIIGPIVNEHLSKIMESIDEPIINELEKNIKYLNKQIGYI